MIISASRRTDIPAFYGEWFLSRLREGYAWVRNPYRPHQISEVPLLPDKVDGFVFWTKRAAPFHASLREIERMGFPYYLQHTLTPYGTEIEALPPKEELLEQMLLLSGQIGPERLVWRYDPIFLSSVYTEDFHGEAFAWMCKKLSGKVARCVISFLDLYPGKMKCKAFSELAPNEMRRIAARLSSIAALYKIPLVTCAELIDLSEFGIGHSACIDPRHMETLCGHPVKARKDPNQRPACGCAESVDIGMYGTCAHRCAYCYASGGRKLSGERHDPISPLLLGSKGPEDIVTVRKRME